MSLLEENETEVADANYAARNNPEPVAGVAVSDSMQPVQFRIVNLSSVSPSPLNPRRHFDDESMQELADSIKAVGILQPLVVRLSTDDFGKTFEIVMGERRWRAAKMAGLGSIPVIIREGLSDGDLLAHAIEENTRRQDLTPIEEAHAYNKMRELEPHLTQEGLAERLGVQQGTMSKILGLLRLPQTARALLDRGYLTRSHGFVLVSLSDRPDLCVDLAVKSHTEQWPQSRLEAEVKAIKAAEAEAAAAAQPSLLEARLPAGDEKTETAVAPPATAQAPVTGPDALTQPLAPTPDPGFSTTEDEGGAKETTPPPPPSQNYGLPDQSTGLGPLKDVTPGKATATTASASAAPASTPVTATSPALAPGVNLAISTDLDDRLFEAGYDTPIQALEDAIRYRLTPLARKALKALIDERMARKPGEEPLADDPTAIEYFLCSFAQVRDIDVQTLKEIPE